MGLEKSCTTSNGGRQDGNEDRVEKNIQAMARTSFVSVTYLGVVSSGNEGN